MKQGKQTRKQWNERGWNTHSKGERVKIPLLPYRVGKRSGTMVTTSTNNHNQPSRVLENFLDLSRFFQVFLIGQLQLLSLVLDLSLLSSSLELLWYVNTFSFYTVVRKYFFILHFYRRRPPRNGIHVMVFCLIGSIYLGSCYISML